MSTVIEENCSVSIADVIGRFLFHCQYERNLNPKTLRAYTTDLKQFSDYVSGVSAETDIHQLTKEVLKGYLQKISHFKAKTIKRKIASLKAMFNHLEFEEDDYINPFRKIKVRFKEPYKLPTVLSIEEVKRVLQEFYQKKKQNPNKEQYTFKAQTRNIAIVELLFATGIRVSELCGLKPGDIDIHNGLIKVFGKGSKERIIQICEPETLTSLKLYHELYEEQIKCSPAFFINRLGTPLQTQSVRTMVKQHVKDANITKNVTPHTFRHTFATLLLEEDVDIKYIQNLLGHSSISITQIYTHVNTEKQRQILSTKHPRRRISFIEEG